MAKYRKKSVVIEARRCSEPETPDSIAAWCGGYTKNKREGVGLPIYVMIPTLEGEMEARPGDYIIKGVSGEFYPCKPEIFEATYEEDNGMGEVSDGYHTFNELYEHRITLFIALMKRTPMISWRSKLHSDGTMFEDFFIAGMELPTGQITYHLPIAAWDRLNGIDEMDKAPEFDGHTPADVLDRLNKAIEMI